MPRPVKGYPHLSIDPAELLADFRLACVSRALDDREILLQKQSRVFFQIAGAGHEILLAALAHSLRASSDWFFPYYRDRALVLALGVSPYSMLLQAVGSADDPASGGRQMPCHWGNAALNIVTQSSPTGSQCLPAVGCAEAGRYLSGLPGTKVAPDEITYVSLGEGTTSEGEFWESLNTACHQRLPVLYLVADNGYAISVKADDQSAAPISELLMSYRGLEVLKVDGWDYTACRDVGSRAVNRVRSGAGPALIHARVTRPYSHSAADTQAKYRPAAELLAEAAHDPIDVFRTELIASGLLTEQEASEIRAGAKIEVAAAADQAMAARRPEPISVRSHLFAAPPAKIHAIRHEESGPPLVMADAIRLCLFELMENDRRIRVFGEDVADSDDPELEGKGGVFGVTRGLQRRFGSDRCYNTPLAESNIIGRGVGQALRGLKPCTEIQFFDYIWPAMQQLRSEAATIRWRSNGSFSCPLVVRVAIGGYLTGGAIWHSQCGESIFTHIPGLMVAFPSRAADAVGLLRSAFDLDDPVLFLEHKHLYRQHYCADPMPDSAMRVPFGKGSIVKPGLDLSIVTWGATVQKSLQAAEILAQDGLSCEVIDLRTLSPWDSELVEESVDRTGRLVVVHEDTLTSGFGAEITAHVAEHCFWSLDAPVVRVAAADTPIAYEPTLEHAILPQVQDIVEAARSTTIT